MGLLSNVFKKETLPSHEDTEILAPASGEMIPASRIDDQVFSEEMMGQTIGFIPTDDSVVSPANGTLEVLYPTGHAFAIRMKDGTGLLIHIGIDTVNLNGKGFTVLKKQGDAVKAGEVIVKADFEAIRKADLDPVTMLIVSEPKEGAEKIGWIDFQTVSKGQTINR